jgi:hypothetical protein
MRSAQPDDNTNLAKCRTAHIYKTYGGGAIDKVQADL